MRQYVALRALDALPSSQPAAASYAVSVRRASALPTASSGFDLAMDTLAVRLTIPPCGSPSHAQTPSSITDAKIGKVFHEDEARLPDGMIDIQVGHLTSRGCY